VITPFPTPDQRQVLRELDSLASEFRLSPEQRQRVKLRFLATVHEGRSTAVAVAEARRELHGRPHTQTTSGPSAA
jgi:hypothetical protein